MSSIIFIIFFILSDYFKVFNYIFGVTGLLPVKTIDIITSQVYLYRLHGINVKFLISAQQQYLRYKKYFVSSNSTLKDVTSAMVKSILKEIKVVEIGWVFNLSLRWQRLLVGANKVDWLFKPFSRWRCWLLLEAKEVE